MLRYEGYALIEDGQVKCASTVCTPDCPNRDRCQRSFIFVYEVGKEGGD